jgi:large subunit ribosomal protein L7/L12
MQTFEWAIEDIIAAHPNLYLEHCAVMAVALMSRLSASPCEFTVECEGFSPPALSGETAFRLRASWAEQTALKAQRVWHTEQPKSIVERAAVAVAAPGAASGAAEPVEEKSTYDLELTEAGGQKIAVIKAVREVTGLGLSEAKQKVDTAPQVLKAGMPKAEAEEAKKKLEAAGAKVTLK